MIVLLAVLLAVAGEPDRSGPPPVAPPVAMVHPEPVVGVVDGVRVWSMQVVGARKVAIHLRFERGGLDLDPSGDPPALQALDALWGSATEQTDAIALAERVDDLGADLGGYVSARVAGMDVSVPRAHADEGAALLAEVAWTPVFPSDEHRLNRRDQADWYLRDGPMSPGAVAGSALAYAWYPPDHPSGRRPDPRAWRRLPLRDVREAYEALITDIPAEVFVVGDIDRARAEALARVALAGHGRDGERGPPASPVAHTGTSIVAVDMPGKDLASVRMRMPGPGRAAPDVLAAEVASYALTGHFLARLNRNLREEKGYTYGLWGGLSVGERSGLFDLGVDVKAGNVGDTLREIDRELARVATEGVRADEVDLAWRSFVGNWNQWFLNTDSAIGGYERAWWRRVSVAELRGDLDGYRAVTPEATRDAAARWWGADAPRLWVVVGDRAVLGPQFDALGVEVRWITPEDAILGAF